MYRCWFSVLVKCQFNFRHMLPDGSWRLLVWPRNAPQNLLVVDRLKCLYQLSIFELLHQHNVFITKDTTAMCVSGMWYVDSTVLLWNYYACYCYMLVLVGLPKTWWDRENHHMHQLRDYYYTKLYYILFLVIIIYFINSISCFWCSTC